MTDNETIKALECCLSSNYEDCLECPLHSDFYPDSCRCKRDKNALALINRQKAEIRTLAAERDNYKKWYFSTVKENKQIRKDFVEFLNMFPSRNERCKNE